MRKRNIFSVLVLIALLVSLPGCRGRRLLWRFLQPMRQELAAETLTVTQAPPYGASEERVIRIGHMGITNFANIYIAIEKGFFAEQGLEVELEQFKTGSDMIAPLSLGHLDVGAGETGTALLNAAHQGLDVRVIMSTGFLAEGHNYMNLVVRKELVDAGEVKGVPDLKGRRVAVNTTRGMNEYLLYEVLGRAGLALEDVELVILPPPDMAQALANKAVDAALVQYPVAAKVLDPGENGEPPIAEVLVPGAEFTVSPCGGVLYYGKRLLDPKNHDLAVKVTVANLKAFRLLRDDSWREDEQILQAISKYTKLPPEAVSKSILPAYDPAGVVDPRTIETMQNYLVGRGYTEYSQPVPVERLIDNSILQDALAILDEGR